MRRLFIQTGAVLHAPELAVGIGCALAYAWRQQTDALGALEQGDIASVVGQFGELLRVGQHQKLHRKFGIHHSTGAVFDIKTVTLHRTSSTYLVAHGHNFMTQQGAVAWCRNDAGSDLIKPLSE